MRTEPRDHCLTAPDRPRRHTRRALSAVMSTEAPGAGTGFVHQNGFWLTFCGTGMGCLQRPLPGTADL